MTICFFGPVIQHKFAVGSHIMYSFYEETFTNLQDFHCEPVLRRDPNSGDDAKNAASTMSGCQRSFYDALSEGEGPLPSHPQQAAAEVIRRTVGFIESAKMPLRVVCKTPETAASEEEMLAEKFQLAESLAEVARKVNEELKEECFKVEEMGTVAWREGLEEWGNERFIGERFWYGNFDCNLF